MLCVIVLSVAAPFFLLIQTKLKMNRILFLINKENFNLCLWRIFTTDALQSTFICWPDHGILTERDRSAQLAY